MTKPLHDSGDRTELHGGAVRDMAPGRGRYDLLSPFAMRELAIHAEQGASKYGEHNWTYGFDLSTILNSGLRHMQQLLAGDDSENHAAAAMWSMMAFMHQRHMIREGLLPADLANYTFPHIENPVTAGLTDDIPDDATLQSWYDPTAERHS